MNEKVRKKRGERFQAKQPELAVRTAPCPTPQKVPYASRAVAKLKRKQVPKRQGETYNVYRCECGCYHLGTLGSFNHRSEARQVATIKLNRE